MLRRDRRTLLIGAGAVLVVVVVAVLLLAGRGGGRLPSPPPIGGGGPTPTGETATPGASYPTPIHHVWLIVLENRSYGQIIGSEDAPNLNQLAGRYGVATDYHAVARPSQPNYIALVAGSTLGVSDDSLHDLSGPNLFLQLEAAGRSWRVYAENMPAGCFTRSSASGGVDGSGTYVRKHNPAISFTDISHSPRRCAWITDFSHFDPGAADFSLIIPNLCHDMHDCSVKTGDRWLGSFVGRITGSPAFRDGGLLLVTFDEARDSDQSQHIALVYAGPAVAPGSRAIEAATHYDLLRTIQDAFDLPCLAASCQARAIPELIAAQ